MTNKQYKKRLKKARHNPPITTDCKKEFIALSLQQGFKVVVDKSEVVK
jgi:hypothetical protein